MSTSEYEYRIFVLDTSFLLDHPDFADFDYGVSACTLMIPNRVQQEIARKHDDPQKGMSARELDRKFKEWAGRGNLRQGLQVNDRVVVKTMPDPVPQDYPELAFDDPRTGYDDRIIAAAKEVVKKYPKAIVKLVTLDHNQFNRAETNDVEAADETVLNSDRCYRRARAHIDKGERDLALRQLDRAVALHSRNLDAILWRANLHVQAGKKDLAAQDLEKAIQLGLKRADQYCHLARIYRDLGDYEKAAEALQKAEEMGAQSQDLYEEWKELGLVTKVVAGLAAEGADFYEMSIKAYRKAITFVPAISSEIARDWYDPNRTPEKVFMFNDLLSVEGETAELLNRIGITYEHWGKLDEAIESYLEALEHHDDAETHYLLGLAYKAKAMSEFEQIWTDERWQYHAMREVIAPLAPILIKGAILIRSGIHLKDLARELNEDVDKVAAAAEEILKAGAPSVSREDIVVDLDLDVPDIWLKANLASLVAAKFWILAIEE